VIARNLWWIALMANHNQLGGKRAMHERWHVRKNRRVVGCVFCGLPANDAPIEPPAPPIASQEGTAQTPTTEADKTFEKVQAEFRQQEEQNKFRTVVWNHALSGLNPDESALLLGLQIPMLLGMVEQEFNVPWVDLVKKARLDVRQRCVTAALKAAENGDVRLLLKLKESGYSLWSESDANEGRKQDVKKFSDEEIWAEHLKHLEARGILKWKESMNQPGSTITMRDATPEEIADFNHSARSSLGFSRTLDYDGHQIPTSEVKSSSETLKPSSGINDDKPCTLAAEPTVELVPAVLEEALGPVTARPEQGKPILIKQRG
jgi:hypothetical protein